MGKAPQWTERLRKSCALSVPCQRNSELLIPDPHHRRRNRWLPRLNEQVATLRNRLRDLVDVRKVMRYQGRVGSRESGYDSGDDELSMRSFGLSRSFRLLFGHCGAGICESRNVGCPRRDQVCHAMQDGCMLRSWERRRRKEHRICLHWQHAHSLSACRHPSSAGPRRSEDNDQARSALKP